MRILVDCDGVLADYCQACFDLIKQVTGKVHTLDEVTHWDLFDALGYGARKDEFRALQSQPGFCASFQVRPGAQDAIKRLGENHEVVVVTSPMTVSTWAYERTLWLKQHFGIPKERIVHTAGKQYVEGDVLIDDSPEHCEAWKKKHPLGLAILWDAPYNRDHTHWASRVKTWEEVDEQIYHFIEWRAALKTEGWG